MDIKRYLLYTLPLLILFFIFCWFIIPNFLPALMPKRNLILLCGAVFFLILSDLFNIMSGGNKK